MNTGEAKADPDTGRGVLGSSVFVLVGEAVSRLVAFAGIPVAAFFLTDRELGKLAIAMLVFSLMIIVFDFGVPGATTKLHFDSLEARQLSSLWWLQFALVASVVVAAIALGPLVTDALLSDVEFYPLVLVIVLAAAGGALVAFGQARYRARFEFHRFASLSLARAVLLVGPAILGAYITETALGYVAGVAVGQIGLGLATVLVLRGEIGAPAAESWRPALSFGLPLVPHLLFGWWLNLADRLLLERWRGLEEVGLYALAYQLSFAVGIVALALNNVWAPHVYEWHASRGSTYSDSRAAAVAPIAWLTSLALTALTALAAPLVFGVIRPSTDVDHRVYVAIALSSVFYAIYLMAIAPVLARGRSLVVPFVTGLGAALNLVLNVALIPELGATGAAIATLIGYGATALATAFAGYFLGFTRSLTRRLMVGIGAVTAVSAVVLAVPGGTADILMISVVASSGIAAGALARRLIKQSNTAESFQR